MNVEELLRARNELERNLAHEIYLFLEDFKKRTGISVSSVSVQMQETTAYGDKMRAYIVADVECKLVIE